jgi:hypothetical protein
VKAAVFQLLSRRELRPFRQHLGSDEDLRLCGKRLHVHCDSNADANVSADEWKACVGATNGTACCVIHDH